jgi:hypothetical protein
MTDSFTTIGDSPAAPARRCFVIAPHDTNELPFITKAIRADGDGVIILRTVDGPADVAHPVRAGERIDVRAQFVRATGTTGQTSIIGYA